MYSAFRGSLVRGHAMVRRFRSSFAWLVLSFCIVLATARPAELPRTPSAQSDSSLHITFGQSVIPLYGPWRFSVGDSPIDPATRTPLWAEPGFDDSNWETVDLTPERGAIDRIAGLSSYVPGWAAKGHRGYWGYGWYRIRVQLQARPDDKLALAGPSDADDAYQAFDNGKLLGSFGDFSKSPPAVYFTRPMMFQLPPSEGESGRASTQVLAIRVWMEPSTLAERDDSGGLHTAPLLGQLEAISA